MYYDFIESFKCRTLTLSLSKKWVTFLCPMLAFLINDDFKGLRSILFNIINQDNKFLIITSTEPISEIKFQYLPNLAEICV